MSPCELKRFKYTCNVCKEEKEVSYKGMKARQVHKSKTCFKCRRIPKDGIFAVDKKYHYSCTKCEKTIEIGYNAWKRRESTKSKLCHKCSASSQNHAWTEKRLSTPVSEYIKTSDTLIFDILDSSDVTNRQSTHKVLRYIDNCSIYKNHKKIGYKRFIMSESNEIFKRLGLNHNSVNTKLLKEGCLKYLINLDKKRLFNVLNHILSHRKRPLITETKNGVKSLVFSDFKNKLEPLFKKIGFDCYRTELKQQLRVTSGSFYINNEWIHIGE